MLNSYCTNFTIKTRECFNLPRKVYRGSYQNERNRSKKKKAIAITIITLIIIATIVAIGMSAFNKNGYGVIMQSSIEEVTQLRIRVKELEDEIAALKAENENYKSQLALYPAVTASPIQPPNDAVATMQETPAPTETPAPKSTKKPRIPTQPPTQGAAPTQQPVQAPVPEPPAPEPVTETVPEPVAPEPATQDAPVE